MTMAHSRTAPGDGGSLSRELERMIDRAPRPPAPARQYRPALMETPKMETGIKLNSNGTVTLNGTTYSRAEFRAELEVRKQAALSDPQSAYYNARDPNHPQVVEEVALANKFLGGELSAQDEHEIVGEWNEALQETTDVNIMDANQELAAIAGSSEGRIARQRAQTGQPLSPQQRAIENRRIELEAQVAAQARAERPAVGGMLRGTDKFIPQEVFAISKLPPREQVNVARELRAKWRNDPKSAYSDPAHPDHAAHVEAMQLLYKAETMDDGSPVLGDEK